MRNILIAGAIAPLCMGAAALTVDFGTEVGKVRPELHSSGFGPSICSQTERDLAELKAMNFQAARTHDWALINPNQRVCDYFHIFPLPQLDATKPENYWFEPTDYLLEKTRAAGLDIFFRLGTSIEHSGKVRHFNSRIPEDYDKLAEIFAATVRHYNRKWANGYDWGVRYWEIWNEPEGITSMWCDDSGKLDREGLKAEFVKFFVVALKRLKDEFGDSIKVGGPALQTYREDWFRAIFAACREAGLTPDFISWHGYENDPMTYNRQADAARALCDEYGFTKCELIINEWHYFGENYTWDEMQRCSDPEIKAKIWDGPDSHNGIRGSCFTLAALANLQRSKLTQAYYYGCRRTGSWGYKDERHNKYKIFFALKMFGDLMRDYTAICDSTSEGSVTTFAVRNAAGGKALMVVDYGGASRTLRLDVKGVAPDAKPVCTLLDYRHDLEPIDVTFKDGTLTLVKPDFHSAAFMVRFDR